MPSNCHLHGLDSGDFARATEINNFSVTSANIENFIQAVNQVLAKGKREDVQKALPDEASKTALGERYCDSLRNDLEVKKDAYEDIKKLTETIRNIRAGFVKVSGDLIGFDAAEMRDANGQVVKLGPQWQPYIQACLCFC